MRIIHQDKAIEEIHIAIHMHGPCTHPWSGFFEKLGRKTVITFPETNIAPEDRS